MKTALPMIECCAPVSAPIAEDEANRLAAAFGVLADPTRLRLMSLIAEEGEACVCDLTASVGLAQPTVSHHLRLLHQAGLVEREQRGKWAYFRSSGRPLRELVKLLRTSFGG
ncbi:MAG: metalloregulator ArsR/SmtB family transcription factor [Actinomycetota bacterium]